MNWEDVKDAFILGTLLGVALVGCVVVIGLAKLLWILLHTNCGG